MSDLVYWKRTLLAHYDQRYEFGAFYKTIYCVLCQVQVAKVGLGTANDDQE